MSDRDKFFLRTFNSVKYHGQIFSEEILFDNTKQHIQFSSKFHAPDYLSYGQISRIDVQRDPKNWLYWVGALTFAVFVGLFLILYRVYLPPWKITIHLKKEAPLVIRARLTEAKLNGLLTSPQVSIQLLQEKKKE